MPAAGSLAGLGDGPLAPLAPALPLLPPPGLHVRVRLVLGGGGVQVPAQLAEPHVVLGLDHVAAGPGVVGLAVLLAGGNLLQEVSQLPINKMGR